MILGMIIWLRQAFIVFATLGCSAIRRDGLRGAAQQD